MTLRLYGSTSGYTELAPPAVAGDNTLTLPATGFGKVLQVVQGTTTTSTSVASTTYTDTTLTATITPSSATSKILILVSQNTNSSKTTQDAWIGVRIMRDATVAADFNRVNIINAGTGLAGVVYHGAVVGLTYLDSPNTTSAVVYKTQGKIDATAGSGSANFQWGSSLSTMTLIEVAA